MKSEDDPAQVSRRTLLKTAALLTSAVGLSGCEHLVSQVTEQIGQNVPEHVGVSTTPAVDPVFHLLSRAAYGPWPGDIDRVRKMGMTAWIDEQLQPDKIDDNACRLRTGRFESVHLDPGTTFEYKKPVIKEELIRHTLLQSVYSKRQLQEVMVEFWTDHLNIDINKGDCIYMKGSDDRLVVRKHALGNFYELIKASALSPAMLVYLDGNQNKKAKPEDIPNENYGRELLELHTLGVNGGYTQNDVYEAARCLTGWRIHDQWQRGKVYFDPQLHDNGAKVVLGEKIAAGGGEKDVENLVRIACSHPSTAKHIATKLVRRLVSEDPPQHLIDEVSEVFVRTRGDIKPMVRTILLSQEFSDSAGAKIKRPYQYIVTCLRALGADTYAHSELVEYLARMGQGPFQYPTPDGYPDEAKPWLSTLLWRWNFALALVNKKVPTVDVSLERLASAIYPHAKTEISAAHLMPHFVGRLASETEVSAFQKYLSTKSDKDAHLSQLVALILSSPAFQRC
ncbi:MAG TPA: DUF1800 family protein [Drouetiella sp.]|jgi:uncharacterized protein (DUF1800 family)